MRLGCQGLVHSRSAMIPVLVPPFDSPPRRIMGKPSVRQRELWCDMGSCRTAGPASVVENDEAIARTSSGGLSNAHAVARKALRGARLHAQAEREQLVVWQINPVWRICPNATHHVIAAENQRRRRAPIILPISNFLDEPGDSVRVADGAGCQSFNARGVSGFGVQSQSKPRHEIPFGVARNSVGRRSIARARWTPPWRVST
jgi:hypothetical protein